MSDDQRMGKVQWGTGGCCEHAEEGMITGGGQSRWPVQGKARLNRGPLV